MALTFKGASKMDKQMEMMEYLSIQMGHIREVKLSMENQEEKVHFIIQLMDLLIQDNGKMANHMEKEFKNTQMVLNIEGSLNKEKKKESILLFYGPMEKYIRVPSKMG